MVVAAPAADYRAARPNPGMGTWFAHLQPPRLVWSGCEYVVA